MASAKIATLAIRTIAKPISNMIKKQAQEHPTFRGICISLAQAMYRSEVRLRANLLGENPKHTKPLSEAKAISNGANTLAEGFLFAVAAGLILAESWRSSRNQAKRRDKVDDHLDELSGRISEVQKQLEEKNSREDARWKEETLRNDELARVLSQILDLGLRGGWIEMSDSVPVQRPPPLQIASSIRDHLRDAEESGNPVRWDVPTPEENPSGLGSLSSPVDRGQT
ncbi:OPA3-domain-containing protein [Dacryopinax primogenitus]|uniref:OPA3-domain-containing protein n=1 Tax=Dacryopinax primogenitus (strain DJM 731) TaxID=1858805 RepID=M5GGQ7_DACPD|nr:OPA3-domain-containing protein [Dacryopinax primogenitus]EJU05908.1 OPA3-domain-containing protein [Dacryopinax primogenitus]